MPAKTTKPSEDMNNLYGYSDMEWAVQLDPAYAARARWIAQAAANTIRPSNTL